MAISDAIEYGFCSRPSGAAGSARRGATHVWPEPVARLAQLISMELAAREYFGVAVQGGRDAA
jgi:hypothetical protein